MGIEVRVRKAFVATLNVLSCSDGRFGRKLTDEEIMFFAELGTAMAMAPETDELTADQLFNDGEMILEKFSR